MVGIDDVVTDLEVAVKRFELEVGQRRLGDCLLS